MQLLLLFSVVVKTATDRPPESNYYKKKEKSITCIYIHVLQLLLFFFFFSFLFLIKRRLYGRVEYVMEGTATVVDGRYSAAFRKLICILRSVSYTSEQEVMWLATSLEVQAMGERWRGCRIVRVQRRTETSEKSHLSCSLCLCSVNRSSMAATLHCSLACLTFACNPACAKFVGRPESVYLAN